MRGHIRPYEEFLWLAASILRFLCTLMISLDILAVKNAVKRYEKVAGAKVNFDKSEGLQLGAWKRGSPLPGLFLWSDGPVRILGVWFGPDVQLEQNW